MPQQAQSDIDIALKQIKANRNGYDTYARYLEGDQRLAFATEKFSNAFGSLFREFADNLCQGVVDAPADRLIVTGFSVEQGGAAMKEKAWKLWQANRMDQCSGEAHQSALTLGDSYVIVWPNLDGVPRIYINDARSMYVRYDEEDPGRLLWAAKAWVADDKRRRVNLYYPDRIEKYVSRNPGADNSLPDSSRTLVPYEVPGEAWPLPNPYELVPVFHLANNAPPGKFGSSELKHVIPIQDALNKSVSDMLVAMEFVAFPQRYATGIQITVDTEGKPKAPFNPGVDRLWATSGENAKFGEFAAADLSNFLKVSDSFRFEIARISGTPLHYFMLMSDPPSGEALKALEARFIKKVKDRQGTWGNVWENVMGFALRVAGEAKKVALSTEWQDAAPTSEAEKVLTADTLLNKLRLDERYVWPKVGVPQAEIDRMLLAKEAAQAEAQQAQAQQAQADALQLMQQSNAPTNTNTQPGQNGAQKPPQTQAGPPIANGRAS